MKRMILSLMALCLLVAPLHAAEIEVEGLKVHYTVQGSGPTLFFVHGWTCDETSWRLQVPAFARDHRVITIDLPGHGKSQVPAQEKFSMDLFAAAVEAVRTKVGANRVVLVGHSMGAVVIGHYALNYPTHVAGLVAADGSLVRTGTGLRSPGLSGITREQRESLINGMFVTTTTPALRTEILKMMLGTSDVTASGAMSAMFSSSTPPGTQIAAPALSIYAGTASGRDEAIKQTIPKWESTGMAGAGHFLMMEKPEEFNRLLAGFIKDRAAWN